MCIRDRQQQQQQQQQNANSSAALVHTNNNTTDEQKAMATFVLSSFVRDFPAGQKYCFNVELLNKICLYIDFSEVPLLRQWCIILIGQLYVRNPLNKFIFKNEGYLERLTKSLRDPVPEVRCAALLSLSLIHI